MDLDNAFADMDQGAPNRPRHCLPPLSQFSGERSKYRAWRTEARIKLSVDGSAYGSEEAKIGAIHAALTGVAKVNCTAKVSSLLEEETPQVDSLLAYLDLSYANRHEVQQALQKLATLKQGNKTFASFLPDFERLMADAGGASWPEDVKKDKLSNAVASDILAASTAVLATSPPDTYNGLVELFSGVAAQQEFVARRSQLDGPSRPPQTRRAVGPADPDAMDWEPTPVRSRVMNANGHRNGPGLPDDNVFRGRRAKWISEDEYRRRRSEHLCLRCSRPGCRTALCPLAAAVRPRTQVRQQTIATNIDPSAFSDLVEPGNE